MNNASNTRNSRRMRQLFSNDRILLGEIKSKFGLCKYKQDPYYANTVKMCAMQTRIMQMSPAEHLFPLSYGARAFYASLRITPATLRDDYLPRVTTN